MFDIYSQFTPFATNDTINGFAGGNTGKGFQMGYPFTKEEDEWEWTYYIKGCSGCGKSTLMKTVARAAENAGFSCERYACGSDPESLDALVIDGRIVMLDATSPHAKEPTGLGIHSETVDLSSALIPDKLKSKSERLVSLLQTKKEAYRSAYCYLHALEVLESEKREYMRNFFDERKAEKAISRILSKQTRNQAAQSSESVYSHAISMKGLNYLPNVQSYRNKIVLHDSYGTIALFFHQLENVLKEKKIAYSKAVMPIGNMITQIWVGNEISFTVLGADGGEVYGMNRFLTSDFDGRKRAKVRLNDKIEKELLTAVKQSLAKAGDAHFEIENLYQTGIDFARVNEMTERLTKEILSRL